MAKMRAQLKFIDEVPGPAIRIPSYNLAFLPHFQNMIQTTQAGRDWVSSHRDDIFSPRAAVTRKAFDDANVELPEGMENQMQRGKNLSG